MLGVDEYIWHHIWTKPIDAGGQGPKELTGMVNLTRDATGRTRARLLDLVPGRSGEAYRSWLHDRGPDFRERVEITALDGVPRRQEQHRRPARRRPRRARRVPHRQVRHQAPRGCAMPRAAVDARATRPQGGPLYGIRNLLRAGQEHPTDRQRAILERAWNGDGRHLTVEVAWHCAPRVRACYHQVSHRQGRALAVQVLDSLPSCPIPEVACLGRTLRTWRAGFLGYFDSGAANNGGTEAINGLIELHRRIARGFRNLENYWLRMLLIGGGLFT